VDDAAAAAAAAAATSTSPTTAPPALLATSSAHCMKMKVDDVGDVDCLVVAFASTSLYPAVPRENSVPFEGQFVQGATVWTENEGCRVVVVLCWFPFFLLVGCRTTIILLTMNATQRLAYPNEYRFNGTMRLNETHVAFTASGNTTLWLTRLVEHAVSEFVTFLAEETLHRQGHDVGEKDESVARVSELTPAASQFLKSLARPSSSTSN